MTVFQAIILGAVQGLTEFLPVSSSGHLVIFSHILGTSSDSSLLFEILIHLATLTAVGVFFFKDILALRRQDLLHLLIGTIPAVIAGFALKDSIEAAFSSLLFVGLALLVTAGFLLFAHLRTTQRTETASSPMTPLRALLIGVFQAIAIFPGVSRSGSTVSGALIANIERKKAFSFSFLLSIPAILGATLLTFLDMLQSGEQLPASLLLPYAAGALTAFVVGLISLRWFQKIVHSAKLYYFALYCVAVSIGILLYLFVA